MDSEIVIRCMSRYSPESAIFIKKFSAERKPFDTNEKNIIGEGVDECEALLNLLDLERNAKELFESPLVRKVLIYLLENEFMHKIPMIKMLRSFTNLGLKTCKNFVDSL